MTMISPVSGTQAGTSVGGGMLDSIKSAISGGSGTAAPTQSDGSVGLWDGVLKKAALGGAAGAAIGFLPFLPGGPILGGIMGALGGAAMGVFTNWGKMKSIKQENEATLAALGVQTDDPQVQAILKSGNVDQLIPYMQAAQQGAATQGTGAVDQTTGVDQSTAQYVAAQQAAAQQAATQAATQTAAQTAAPLDPTAGTSQSPVPDQSGAIGPATGADPGVAPSGGATDAAAGVASLSTAELAVEIAKLDQQIAALKALLEAARKKEEAEQAMLAAA